MAFRTVVTFNVVISHRAFEFVTPWKGDVRQASLYALTTQDAPQLGKLNAHYSSLGARCPARPNLRFGSATDLTYFPSRVRFALNTGHVLWMRYSVQRLARIAACEVAGRAGRILDLRHRCRSILVERLAGGGIPRSAWKSRVVQRRPGNDRVDPTGIAYRLLAWKN